LQRQIQLNKNGNEIAVEKQIEEEEEEEENQFSSKSNEPSGTCQACQLQSDWNAGSAETTQSNLKDFTDCLSRNCCNGLEFAMGTNGIPDPDTPSGCGDFVALDDPMFKRIDTVCTKDPEIDFGFHLKKFCPKMCGVCDQTTTTSSRATTTTMSTTMTTTTRATTSTSTMMTATTTSTTVCNAPTTTEQAPMPYSYTDLGVGKCAARSPTGCEPAGRWLPNGDCAQICGTDSACWGYSKSMVSNQCVLYLQKELVLAARADSPQTSWREWGGCSCIVKRLQIASTTASTTPQKVNTCTWSQEMQGTYIPGCSKNCQAFSTLSDAQAACAVEPTCGGVTYSAWGSQSGFQLRQGPGIGVSPSGERTWQKVACATAEKICTWSQEMPGKYIPGCSKNCQAFSTLSDAQAACAVEPTCGGVTHSAWGSQTGFQLRQGPGIGVSPSGERTWQKGSCGTPR